MKIDNIYPLLDGGKKLPLVEDFYTIQGEGYNTGKAAYFIRLGGCDVGCKWCDAKESWNPKLYPPTDVDQIIAKTLECKAQSIVITGGEPLLYPLDYITTELKKQGVEIFLETSGSHPLSGKFDWICLSPKRNLPPLKEIYSKANELKVIIQDMDVDIAWAEECRAKVGAETRLYLQPEWSKFNQNIDAIVEYIKTNPEWSISLQTHKFMRIP